MPLLDLIVKTGIAKAIATQLGGLKGNRNAIAETIENNVRRKIIKERLNDPAYYEKMSALLDEIIAARKAKAIEYEEFLKRVAELINQVQSGQAEGVPAELKTNPALRALYNNLKKPVTSARHHPMAEESGEYRKESSDSVLNLALKIDQAVRQVRPDDWRGVAPRERIIKQALYGILNDVAEVERIFLIIKQQPEY